MVASPRRRRANRRKDPGADDRTDAEPGQLDRTEAPAQLLTRPLRVGEEAVKRLGAEKPAHPGRPHCECPAVQVKFSGSAALGRQERDAPLICRDRTPSFELFSREHSEHEVNARSAPQNLRKTLLLSVSVGLQSPWHSACVSQ
jgi:hypothetical protein